MRASDSRTYRTFCQTPLGHKALVGSTLAAAIKKIRPKNLEAIHHILVVDAAEPKIETGKAAHVSCTAVETLMQRTHRLSAPPKLYPDAEPADEEGSRPSASGFFRLLQPKEALQEALP